METKICSKCKRELPIDQFHFRDKAKGTRRSDCKECHNGYVKIKYSERQKEIEDIKSNLKCAKCGDTRGYLLDFHHLDPKEKDRAVSRMISNNASNETIEAEMKKCICLCANCHREFHYFEKSGMTIEQYLN